MPNTVVSPLLTDASGYVCQTWLWDLYWLPGFIWCLVPNLLCPYCTLVIYGHCNRITFPNLKCRPKTSVSNYQQRSSHKTRSLKQMPNIKCNATNPPAHGPYFLRLIREMPHGARKKAQNPPNSCHSRDHTNLTRYSEPNTAAMFLQRKV